eukprot:4767614-Heterocapsa_arctica.AAC.1
MIFLRTALLTCVHGIAGMMSSEPLEGGLDEARDSQYSSSTLHSVSNISQGGTSEYSSSSAIDEAGEAMRVL